MHMQETMKQRGADRRKGVSSHFTSPENNRRRPSYERRNRTTVQPMPLSMMFRRDKRRFEESGTEYAVKGCRDSIVSRFLVHHVRAMGKAKPGHRISSNGLSAAFADARDAVGILPKEGRTPVTFHEIRSLAERLYRDEFGAEFAQMILGHKTAAMTARYDDLRGEWKVISAA